MEAAERREVEVVSLVERAIARDQQAFAELYDRYFDRVYRHILYKVGSQPEAEDLTADVFLRAWQAIQRYRQGNQPFIAWLFTIAHNAIVDHYRRNRPVSGETDELIDHDIFANPAALADLQITQVDVWKAIRQLKSDQRQVILLRFIDDMSYSEVAGLLGKTEGAIRVIQHRALQTLARYLRQYKVIA